MELVALIVAGLALGLQLLARLAAKTDNKLDDAVVKMLQDPRLLAAVKEMLEKRV